MARWAIIDRATGLVLNVIEAEENFINELKNKSIIVIDANISKKPEEVHIIQTEVASKDDIILNKKEVYRKAGELEQELE